MVYKLDQEKLQVPLSRAMYDLASAKFQVWLDEQVGKVIGEPRNDLGLEDLEFDS